jgi:hypothetical protein
MSVTDISFAGICEQRKRQMLYNVPQIRLMLTSPYPTHTQNQLDMRRKAEILKYSNTASSTKTNNSTKAQKWAQLASGMSQKSSYTTLTGYEPDVSGVYQQYIKKIGNPSCMNDGLIPTPTSSCDVPGPISYLIHDESIPLYNYMSDKNRTYAFTQVESTNPWQMYISNDNKSASGVETKLFSLYLTSKISQYSYTYNFQIPIAIYITGTNIAASSIGKPVSLRDNSLNISSVSISVKYNNAQVVLQKTPSAYLSNGVRNYDLTANPAPIFNYDIAFTPTSTNDNIMFLAYSGVLNVSNLFLYAQPGYIYDIMATFYVTTQFGNTAFTSTVQTYDYGVYTNISPSNTLITKRTSLSRGTTPYPVPTTYPAFSLAGV